MATFSHNSLGKDSTSKVLYYCDASISPLNYSPSYYFLFLNFLSRWIMGCLWSIINTLSLHLQQTWFSFVFTDKTKISKQFFGLQTIWWKRWEEMKRRWIKNVIPNGIHFETFTHSRNRNRVALQSHVYKDIHVVKPRQS